MPVFKKCKIMQNAGINITSFIFMSIVLSLTGCGNKSPKVEEVIEAKTPVTVTTISRKSISETLEFPAILIYLRKNIVRSSTEGTVENISIGLGDFVKKGQLLFTVKTLEASAIQGYLKGDTNLYFKGIINVNSPENGVIISISHQKSDFVQGGDELAVLSDQSSMVFNLETPFEQRKYIEQSKNCLLRLPDSTLIKGVISGRMPEMNALSQTISFLVKPLTSNNLPQNLMATAVINKQTRENVQVLPRAALLGNETQTEFWIMKVLNDSTAVKVPVRKGIENYDEVEITDPQFLPEDRILMTGNYGLPDTAAITILE
jgi:hypothetical protein